MNKSELSSLLKKYDVRPSREKGQNFLINDDVIHKMIKVANLEKNDTVLEIGAGFGNLTTALAEKVDKVITIEPDQAVFPALYQQTKENKNIILLNEDVFKVNFEGGIGQTRLQNGENQTHPSESGFHQIRPEIRPKNFKIVANLPYHITSKIFRYFLEHGPRPKSMTVMVQKEVAQRICAKVGQKSLLSLSIELYSDPEIAFLVPKTDFVPRPKVDSAIINLPNIGLKFDVNEKEFFRILRISFSSKRKKLLNNLDNGLKLGKNELKPVFKKLNIKENARPQELSIKTWVSLFDAISQI